MNIDDDTCFGIIRKLPILFPVDRLRFCIGNLVPGQDRGDLSREKMQVNPLFEGFRCDILMSLWVLHAFTDGVFPSKFGLIDMFLTRYLYAHAKVSQGHCVLLSLKILFELQGDLSCLL